MAPVTSKVIVATMTESFAQRRIGRLKAIKKAGRSQIIFVSTKNCQSSGKYLPAIWVKSPKRMPTTIDSKIFLMLIFYHGLKYLENSGRIIWY